MQAMSVNITLYRLDLTNCGVGPDGAAALGVMLRTNTGLRELVLAGTRIGSSGAHTAHGVHEVACMMDARLCIQRQIYIRLSLPPPPLHSCLPSCILPRAPSGLLPPTFKQALAHNAIRMRMVMPLLTPCTHARTLSSLCPGADALAKCLRHNGTLRELDLSHTQLDDRAAAALAGMLGANKALHRVNLSHTRIGDVGGKALCDALHQNNNIQVRSGWG